MKEPSATEWVEHSRSVKNHSRPIDRHFRRVRLVVFVDGVPAQADLLFVFELFDGPDQEAADAASEDRIRNHCHRFRIELHMLPFVLFFLQKKRLVDLRKLVSAKSTRRFTALNPREPRIWDLLFLQDSGLLVSSR